MKWNKQLDETHLIFLRKHMQELEAMYDRRDMPVKARMARNIYRDWVRA